MSYMRIYSRLTSYVETLCPEQFIRERGYVLIHHDISFIIVLGTLAMDNNLLLYFKSLLYFKPYELSHLICR